MIARFGYQRCHIRACKITPFIMPFIDIFNSSTKRLTTEFINPPPSLHPQTKQVYLFYEPNPDDPLNHEAANLFRTNSASFAQTVQRTLRGGTFQGKTFERLV